MKKITLIFFFTVSLFSQAQQWQWAKQGRGGWGDGTQTVTDNSNNMFAIIYSPFSYLIYGSYTISAESVLAKHDPSGNILWAFGLSSAPASAISCDSTGNVYVCGKLGHNAVFNSASTTATMNVNGYNYDAYLAKYNANGNLLWVKSWGDTISNDSYRTLKSDAQGNCYVSGYSNYTSQVGGTHECGKFYACKYDPNGNLLWVDSTAWENHAEPFVSDLDENGNFYVVGDYYTPVTIGSTTLSLTASWNIFLVKYDKNGNITWAKQQGTNADEAHGISLDGKGHFYLNGFYMSPSTFGTTTLNGPAPGGMFIVKYDTSGSVIWAKREGVKFGRGIACDSSGFLVTGVYQSTNTPSAPSTGTLGVGPNTVILNSPNGQELFIAKYDDNGILKWAIQPGGSSYWGHWSNHISSDKKGNCYVTGDFMENMIVGNDSLTSYSNGVNYDAFIIKIKDSLAPAITAVKTNLQKSESLQIFPNPTGSSVNVLFNTNGECSAIDLYLNDVLGQRLYTKNCKGSRELSEVIDVSHYPKGVYFVELLTPKTREVRKIIAE